MNDRQSRIAAQLAETRELRRQCVKFLPGHPTVDAADEYAALSAFVRENKAEPDVYGQGKFLNDFERKIAELLGHEAAVFMPTGTMAQQIALRLWSDGHVGMHPTSHLELHEFRAYAHLHRLNATLIGPRQRPMLASDIGPERVSAILVELPIRESGGQLPTWEELEALKTLARERKIRLHLDGARLWETRSFYANRTYAEICRGFDSTYVSFYKGIGGLCGAMLAGPEPFIKEARIWQRRHGGNLYQMHPFVVSAAMKLDARLAQMPAFYARAQELARAFSNIDGVTVHPHPPHVNMMHLHFPRTPDALQAARNRVAKEDRIWLFGAATASDVPGHSYVEVYIGENALKLDVEETARSLAKLLQ
jgi:threonine aldolase